MCVHMWWFFKISLVNTLDIVCFNKTFVVNNLLFVFVSTGGDNRVCSITLQEAQQS